MFSFLTHLLYLLSFICKNNIQRDIWQCPCYVPERAQECCVFPPVFLLPLPFCVFRWSTWVTSACELGVCLSALEAGNKRAGQWSSQALLPLLVSGLPDTCVSDEPKVSDIPSQTSVITHDIVLTKPFPIKQHAYRVNPAKSEIMRKETDYLVMNGFAVPSCSPWSSPCLLNIKSDGSPRFCTDFRKVNAVTVPDAHPLPLIDDCIDEIGPALHVSKLDMLKGYWQVLLTLRASDIFAFVTPDSFLQYTVMLPEAS